MRAEFREFINRPSYDGQESRMIHTKFRGYGPAGSRE